MELLHTFVHCMVYDGSVNSWYGNALRVCDRLSPATTTKFNVTASDVCKMNVELFLTHKIYKRKCIAWRQKKGQVGFLINNANWINLPSMLLLLDCGLAYIRMFSNYGIKWYFFPASQYVTNQTCLAVNPQYLSSSHPSAAFHHRSSIEHSPLLTPTENQPITKTIRLDTNQKPIHRPIGPPTIVIIIIHIPWMFEIIVMAD